MRPAAAIPFILAAVLPACGGGPASPSAPKFSVELVSTAPATCSEPCLRLEWVQQESLGQDLLKVALRVQAVPAPGISSVSGFLNAKRSGTFSEPTTSLQFERWERGEFFERLGRPVTYEVTSLPDTCCLVTAKVGFPTPTPADRAAGEGNVVLVVFHIREAGASTLDPNPADAPGLPFPFLFLKGYTAEVRVR
jgi:hypothetical protein